MVIKCPECKSKLSVSGKSDHVRCEVCEHVFFLDKEELEDDRHTTD